MGYITYPFRVYYEGKNFRTGLTDVIGYVLRPDNVVQGPFPMPESAVPGRYYFDISTVVGDPEGEYLAIVISPTDSIQDSLRVGLYRKPFAFGNVNVIQGGIQLQGRVESPEVDGSIESAGIDGQVVDVGVDGSVVSPSVDGAVEIIDDIEGEI